MPRPWRVVQVDDLPWPHHPFKCRWISRFDAAIDETSSTKERQDTARDLLTALTAAEIDECPYHEARWDIAAEAAIALVDAGDTSIDAIDVTTRTRRLDESTAEALFSFFAFPIFLAGDELGNGQHRVCAMKLAGVPRCPIED